MYPDAESYITFIQSCYRLHPESFAYYERLVHHIRHGNGCSRSLQPLKVFQIRPNVLEYPTSSLLDALNIQEIWSHLPPQSDKHAGLVAVVEGFLSPWCITSLGSRWAIRPEFFIKHLPWGSPSEHFAESAYLPSLQDNLVRVHYATMINPLAIAWDKKGPIEKQRSELKDLCVQQDKVLMQEKRYGETHLRRLNMHRSDLYSSEQIISFTVVQRAGQWNAVFLLDQGRPPVNSELFPWFRHSSSLRPSGTIPLVPYNNALVSPNSPDDTISQSFDQYHPLKSMTVQDEVDFQLLQQDPFFLLLGSLRMSTMSWAQLLDSVTEDIHRANNELVWRMEELRFHLQQLRFNMSMINRTKEVLSEGLELAQEGGCASWPKPVNADCLQRKSQLQGGLVNDYKYLIKRCDSLTLQCDSVINVLVGFTQTAAAERAIKQSSEVGHLTTIATIFLPLSFATGIFGMNITEWQPALHVYWFFLVLFLVLMLVLSMLNPQKTIGYGRRVREKLRRNLDRLRGIFIGGQS